MKKDIRSALMASGFTRSNATRDFGDGVYVETWTNGTDEILLKWKGIKMTRIESNECRKLDNAGRCEKCNSKTRWTVKVADRWANWCGCVN